MTRVSLISNSRIAALTAAVFLAGTICFLLAYGVVGRYEYETKMDSAKLVADTYSGYMEAEAKHIVADAVSLADIGRQNTANPAWFAPAVKSIMGRYAAVMGAQLSPVGKPPVTYPAGFSLGADSSLRAAFQQLQETAVNGDGTPLLCGPVPLANGQQAVMSVAPIFTYNSKTQHFDFQGTVTMLVKLPDILQTVDFKRIEDDGYAYAVYGNNGAIDKDGVIASSQQAVADDGVTSSARVPGGLWLVKVAPADGWGSGGTARAGKICSVIAALILSAITFWVLRLRQQKELSRRAMLTDHLTQLGNRRSMQEILLELSRRLRARFVVVFIDVDDFKQVNDQYGHKIGDQVLKELAKRAKSCLKEQDYLFRLGGDEFLAIITGESREGVVQRLENIRLVTSAEMVFGDIRVGAAVSMGCAVFPTDSRSPNELLRIADQRMYRHKGILVTEPIDWFADESEEPLEGDQTVDSAEEIKKE